VTINITIPVLDAERLLEGSVLKLLPFLENWYPGEFELVIVDNGSTDGTLRLAREIERKHDRVRVLSLAERGRGRAIKTAWLQSEADILSYMDVDLSSDLRAFPKLIEPLVCGNADLAVGSRLLNSKSTKRSFRREVLSRCYYGLVKTMFHSRFSDPQCGFKTITRTAARQLLPLVQNNAWFFDTELLILAEMLGYRIHDVPVEWTENPDSRVKIISTAIEDILGLMRLRKLASAHLCPRQTRHATE
jgi:glycosyltransferase involved in cell wall biosynthesis